MIILRIIFDSHFIYIYTKKIVFTLFALYVFLLVFVGKFSNSTSIYNSNNDDCTIRSHSQAHGIAIGRLVR